MSIQARRYQIFIRRCDESGVLIVDDSDIPGLHLEAETATEMIEAIDEVAPELIKCNIKQDEDEEGVWIEVLEQRLNDQASDNPQDGPRPKVLIDQNLLAASI